MKRITSGIPGLDPLLQGGYPDKSVNLLNGPPGAGKTIFAMQFLVEGAKKGEPGIYITFQENKDTLIQEMKEFGWDLEKFEKEKKLLIFESTPEQVEKLMKEGSGIIQDVIDSLGAKRLVMDSLSTVIMLYQEGMKKRKLILQLLKKLRQWGCTSLLIDEGSYKEDRLTITTEEFEAEFEVDSIIKLSYDKEGTKGRERSMEILKMRSTKHPNTALPIKIDDDGISIPVRQGKLQFSTRK